MKWNIFSILFFALSFGLFYADQAGTSTVLKVSFEKVVANSELVFEGRVVSKESRLSPSTGNPFTYFTFEIIEVIKGTYLSKTIELGFMGGPKGGHVMMVSDMQMPEIGEKGVYFVESLSREQVHPLYGWHQGHYLVVTDKQRGQDVVIPVKTDSAKSRSSALKQSLTLKDFKRNVRSLIGGKAQ